MEFELNEKYETLKRHVSGYRNAMVAYSGGVDSVFLLKVAVDCLGSEAVLACLGLSESVAHSEYQGAREVADKIGAKMEIVSPNEMQNPNYLANPENRCFFCKTELYTVLADVARERHFEVIFNGTNADDLGDYRPGLQAADDFKVISPLADANLTKSEIRTLSKELDLQTWDKPAQPCLSSRVVYGLSITPKRLSQVERAEEFLREKGFKELRVRHHDKLARIEVPAEQLPDLIAEPIRSEINRTFKELGFTYVSLDLQGFRSGSCNEALPPSTES